MLQLSAEQERDSEMGSLCFSVFVLDRARKGCYVIGGTAKPQATH